MEAIACDVSIVERVEYGCFLSVFSLRLKDDENETTFASDRPEEKPCTGDERISLGDQANDGRRGEDTDVKADHVLEE